MSHRRVLWLFAVLLAPVSVARAAPRFATDVAPILRDNCLGCHQEDDDRGDLRVDTFDLLMKGGEAGAPIVAGKASDSLLVKKVEGTDEPKMPPKKNLTAQEIKILRAWIDAGAPGPTKEEARLLAMQEVPVPQIKAVHGLSAPAQALAFRPDGKALAVGKYREVLIVDVADGRTLARFGEPSDLVRALVFSADGKRLVAAGGRPGRAGEIVVWTLAGGAAPRIIRGHKDAIFDLALSPDGKLFATSSYDKVIKIWEVDSGRELRTLKEHTDAVFPVAFSADGRQLASGAGDRTVKVWDVASGKRLFTLADSLDAVYAVAFHPAGKQLSAAGADKTIRTWQLGPDGGTLVQTITAHGDAIVKMLYAPSGERLVTSSADRLIKVWDMGKGIEVNVIARQDDWAPALAFSPDGTLLATGRHTGAVALYDPSGATPSREILRAPVRLTQSGARPRTAGAR